jgi:hypothetical protein
VPHASAHCVRPTRDLRFEAAPRGSAPCRQHVALRQSNLHMDSTDPRGLLVVRLVISFQLQTRDIHHSTRECCRRAICCSPVKTSLRVGVLADRS